MSSLSLPVISNEVGFNRYLQEIRNFPSLEANEEYILAKRYIEDEDISAAHKLVTSHLKLVAKIALGFRGYGLPLVELVSEGNIGLMQAVKKFNPDLGFRLATYAMWWIKASIQEYILKSWSLVKVGTTAAQRKLFFNLRKIKNRLTNAEARDIKQEDFKEIANQLGVKQEEVIEMNNRLAGADLSLNSTNDEDGELELIDIIPETRANQEVLLADSQEFKRRKQLFNNAMLQLNEREKYILTERRLKEKPATLDELSKILSISRERVRQIEERIIEKLQLSVMHNQTSS